MVTEEALFFGALRVDRIADPDGAGGHVIAIHCDPTGFTGVLYGIFVSHSHDAAASIDDAMEAHSVGTRAPKISLVVVLVTTVVQAVIDAFSGSAALLADTIHNLSDALTAVALWIAFVLSPRVATRK